MTVDIGFVCCKCGQGFGYINRIPIILEIRDRVMARVRDKLIRSIPTDQIIVARATIKNIVFCPPFRVSFPALHTDDHCCFRHSNDRCRFHPTGDPDPIHHLSCPNHHHQRNGLVHCPHDGLNLERNVVRGRDKFGNHFFNASFVEGDF